MDVHGQVGYFERPSGMSEGAHTHVNMLDEGMKEIASEGTWGKPVINGYTTRGYITTMLWWNHMVF